MQKKFLALAVAGALAPAAAMAQVEIYGRANVGFDSYRASGATISGNSVNNRQRIFDSGSRVGFRVNETLGGGMRAFAVIESGVNIDSGSNITQSGAGNSSAGFWASRDSYAGLGGGWGDIRFGRQSVFYGNGIIAQSGPNYINTDVPYFSNGTGNIALPSGRRSNVVSYNSPTVGGFNASVYFSPNAQETAPANVSSSDKEKFYALTARYTGTPIRAQLDWARTNDAGNIGGSQQNGLKLGVGYAYAPGSQLSVLWMRIGCEGAACTSVNVPGVTDARQRVWGVNWEHMIGPWQLLAMYGRAGDVSGTSDTGSNSIMAGAKYHLSKRTGVYVTLNKVTNESNAYADYGPGGGQSGAVAANATGTGTLAGTTALSAAAAGADPRILAIGVMHNF